MMACSSTTTTTTSTSSSQHLSYQQQVEVFDWLAGQPGWSGDRLQGLYTPQGHRILSLMALTAYLKTHPGVLQTWCQGGHIGVCPGKGGGCWSGEGGEREEEEGRGGWACQFRWEGRCGPATGCWSSHHGNTNIGCLVSTTD